MFLTKSIVYPDVFLFPTDHRTLKRLYAIALFFSLSLIFYAGCTNPFAPTLDSDLSPLSSLLGDAHTVEGVFQNIQYAYTYRDTLIYGNVLHPSFQFIYFNAERGADASFNRDEEMRVTWNLFRGADQIDLQWTGIQSLEGDSVLVSVRRGYNLRITLQANETFIIEGLATLRLTRDQPTDVWRIRVWRDDSNG